MKLWTAAAAAIFSVVGVTAHAAVYDLFDHSKGALAATYDYGLRLDGLDCAEDGCNFWSFETEDGDSMATLSVDIDAGTGSIVGRMRNNATDALSILRLTLTGVEGLGGDGSFGATSYSGTLGGIDIDGKAKNVDGNAYEWTLFLSDLGANTDFRAPNITAGWVSNYDGSMLSGINDFIAEVGLSETGSVASVPLPAAGWLLIAGVGALGMAKRRKS